MQILFTTATGQLQKSYNSKMRANILTLGFVFMARRHKNITTMIFTVNKKKKNEIFMQPNQRTEKLLFTTEECLFDHFDGQV